MQPMYSAMVNSPQTELASAITDTDTTITLLDASKLPDPPNLATIGVGETAETILYTGKSGNDLTGVTRGFQGAAQSWPQGTKVARYFTAYDLEAVQQNILSHASRHAADGEDPITPAMIGAETPAGAQAKADQAETNAKAYADGKFLPASQYTAADILNKLKTVDGAGSGLDADTVRGYLPSGPFQPSAYIPVIQGNASPLEIGQYIDFHLASSTNDYDGRVYIDTNKDLLYSKPGVGNFRIWTAQVLRWNPAGYLEYNDGGVWRPVGVFIDKSRCTPLNAYDRQVVLNTSYQTLLSINGKGFLDHFIIKNTNGAASLILRITVDGVVKFHGRVEGAGSGTVLGVLKREFLLSIGTNNVAGFLNPTSTDIYSTTLVEYPYTDTSGTPGRIALMAESIYFTSNLLVEVMSTLSQTAEYSYSGGYM